MGLHWLLIWGPSLPQCRGPIAVSKGIVLALDLGNPSCSRGPMVFDLEPQQSQGALRSSKGASFTLELVTLLGLCSRGQLDVDVRPPSRSRGYDIRRSPIEY